MRDLRPVTILVLVLMIAFALPSLCVSLPMSMAMPKDSMPDGCHGHHHHKSPPAHSCCSAAYQIPAAVQVSPTPVALSTVVGAADTYDVVTSTPDIATAIHADCSSPPPSVLRI